ncbi:MAG: NUDIX hydrolase [Anaerolineae bacterium]|nr:NUDIX hydrolase [Anaerolineae bacterium]MDW8098103.1 NUDIX hydrolase [Anaerolineae bacterium]
MSRPHLQDERWQTLRRRLLLDRRPWLAVWEEDVLLPSGYRIERYLLAETRPYAMVFALTKDGRVPLVCQYKHGLRRMAYDLPAGYLDDTEDPLVCAQRELREETGLHGGEWHLLGSFVLDSNRGEAAAHLFLAIGVAGDGVQHLDPSEHIEVHLLPVAEVAERARAGEINGLASVASVFMALDALRRLGYEQ